MSPPNTLGQSLEIGFKQCGWDTKLITFQKFPEYSLSNPINWIRSPELGRNYKKRFDFILREEVLPLADKCNADLVFVMRPEEVSSMTAEALSNFRRPIAAWIIDSLSRCPSQNALSAYTIANFYLDGNDVNVQNSFWLPLGVNENLLPKLNIQKDIDVLFIGGIPPDLYTKRRQLFKEFAHSRISELYKCAANVSGARGFYGRIQHEFIRISTKFPVSSRVSMVEYIRSISRAKICINVLPDDSGSIVNDAFFLIPFVNTCQLVDKHEYLKTWLIPEEHFCWFEEGKMLEKIAELLKDEIKRKRISENGQREILSNHTYRKRAEGITEIIDL